MGFLVFLLVLGVVLLSLAVAIAVYTYTHREVVVDSTPLDELLK
jgi:hypothetical protein